jgi:TRAP transporter 4TM/12TM fusion protein
MSTRAASIHWIDAAFATRDAPSWLRLCAFALALAMALFHLAVAWVPFVSDFERNTLHFAGFAVLCALVFPMHAGIVSAKEVVVDVLFACIVAVAAVYLAWAEDGIYARGVRLSILDWCAGVVVIVGAIEYARRVSGWIIPCLIVVALAYVAFLGQHVPGIFRFGGLSLESVMFRSIYGDDALFGTISSISATYVFLFIIFGAFLTRSGAGEFVVNIARIVAGRVRGGPGIVAVIASGLTGTINGSAVANTASTGVITIPMMKKAGFDPKFAAAVEAAASTGGQLMPPIMGAGAFVMASYTQIPYEQIALAALMPALLYFASVAIFVRIEAMKYSVSAFEDEEAPSVRDAFTQGGMTFLLPIGLVVWMLLDGYTPTYAAVAGIVAVIASSWLTPRRMGVMDVLNALAMGTRNMVLTAILLCAVGLMINVIATAGIGNTFSLMIMDWSDGNLLIAMILVAIASLVLGMGLPVTAAYIVLATLSAPALAGLIANEALISSLVLGVSDEMRAVVSFVLPSYEPGMDREAIKGLIQSAPIETLGVLRDSLLSPEILAAALLAGHMIVFWLSQDSNVTPPVCLAAFTAAAIAGSHPMRTGLTSWKIAKGLYIVPLLFAYTPILTAPWPQVLQISLCALFGIYGVAACLEGATEQRIGVVMRMVMGVAGIAALWPEPQIAWFGVVGVIGCFLVTLMQTRWRSEKA